MNYALDKVTTVADCDALLELATKDVVEIVWSKLNTLGKIKAIVYHAGENILIGISEHIAVWVIGIVVIGIGAVNKSSVIIAGIGHLQQFVALICAGPVIVGQHIHRAAITPVVTGQRLDVAVQVVGKTVLYKGTVYRRTPGSRFLFKDSSTEPAHGIVIIHVGVLCNRTHSQRIAPLHCTDVPIEIKVVRRLIVDAGEGLIIASSIPK